MNKALFEVLCSFCLDAEPVSCVPYGCGHINETYLTVTASGRRYILQKINHHTFRDVAGWKMLHPSQTFCTQKQKTRAAF